MDSSILTLILLAPLVGAVLIAFLPDRGKLSAWIALFTTLVSFGLTLHLPAHFNLQQTGFQFVVNKPWIESPAIFYHVGVDGLSLWLIVLVGLLGPVGVLASWNSITRTAEGLLLAVPSAADSDVRRLHLAGPDGLLRLLGTLAGSDGDPDRDVRPQGRVEGCHQVLPLHVHSLGAAAGCDSMALCKNGNVQLQRASHTDRRRCIAGWSALLGGTGVSVCVRRQGSGVPASWMARRHLR